MEQIPIKETILQKYLKIKKRYFPVQNPIKLVVESYEGEIQLHTVEYPNEGTMRGVVFIFLGQGSYMDFYGAIFEQFAKQGYRLFGMDRQGFGKSEGKRGDIGPDPVNDQLIFVDKIIEAKKLQDAKKYILGMSLGSLLAARMIQMRPDFFDGVIFTIPWFANHDLWHINPIKRWYIDFISCCSRDSVFTRMKRSEEYEEYFTYIKEHDPLYVGVFRHNTLSKCLMMQDKLKQEWSKIKIPVFMALAGNDVVVSNKLNEELYQQIYHKMNKCTTYEGKPHMLFHQEGDYNQLIVDSIEWLKSLDNQDKVADGDAFDIHYKLNL
ncbi:UNKNOWN [Stylonychia lemnae]|uniref:Serine aminopeptidase S33 domain-containing protein n=1 Tax=Stylonychia lemnae TaxID=5949 RepID=A0A078A5M4_STYLE|nr:UNKNOWN [Stylonychia lemnae]|eukprot:CDW77545.1 UNKNOWN [Stylonychia lemnae]